jgi:hypothetical protein
LKKILFWLGLLWANCHLFEKKPQTPKTSTRPTIVETKTPTTEANSLPATLAFLSLDAAETNDTYLTEVSVVDGAVYVKGGGCDQVISLKK